MDQTGQQKLGSTLRFLLYEQKLNPDGVKLQEDAIERSNTYHRLEQLFSEDDLTISPT